MAQTMNAGNDSFGIAVKRFFKKSLCNGSIVAERFSEVRCCRYG